jgi:hypothetical protein
MLQPERTTHCLSLFEGIGKKLGKIASEDHLRGALRQLLQRTNDVTLQCELLKLSFWGLVRARFMPNGSLLDYLGTHITIHFE